MKPGTKHWWAQAAIVLLGVTLMVPTQAFAQCRGLTWVLRQHIGDVDNVGTDGFSNAYQGDTPCTTALPVLCLRREGLPQPSYITPDFNNGWTGGHIQLTPPRLGTDLTSRATADAICAQTFGAGWSMAEFHDGGGGWGWYAYGSLNTNGRFWVAINDQPANPWDSVQNPPPPPPTTGRIEGFVRDGRGNGIPGVLVDAGNGNTAITNVSGQYVLSNLPLGTYTLRASRAGWGFGSPQFQNVNYTRTLTATHLSDIVNITGWDSDPIVFVHGLYGAPTIFDELPGQFAQAGYWVHNWGQLDTSLFFTPPLEVNARHVKQWVDEAKYVTGRNKVILYAHSMGGLVSRAYVEGGAYENDVSQIFTYGSPHLGAPWFSYAGCLVNPLHNADATCQMTPVGMLLFNLSHFKRSGVDYHLIAGDAPMWRQIRVCFRLFRRTRCLFSISLPDLRYRNVGGWVMGLLIPGKDDAIVQTCSASGMFGSNIDRYLTHEVHMGNVGERTYFRWNGNASEEGFAQCSRRLLIDRNSLSCGSRGWGPPLSCLGASLSSLGETDASSATERAPQLSQLSRIDQDILQAGARKVRSVIIEGGTTGFSASWGEGSATFKLIDPTGQVIDPAYAASIEGDPNDPDAVEVKDPGPEAVVYSGDAKQATYYFPAARPGTWQLVLEGGSDIPAAGTSYTTGASFDSPLQAQFSSDRLFYEPNSAAQLRMNFSVPVQSADVRVTVRGGSSPSETVQLSRVSATEYAASYSVPGSPGYVALDWSVTGQHGDGVAFERGGREFIQVNSTALQLGASHSDRAIPRQDVPGLNSALSVTLKVQSAYEGGDLGASAELVAPDGNVVARTVVTVPARLGQNDVELRFLAEDIYSSKEDGPYTLQNVRLLDERSAPLLSQEVALAHTTQAYTYRSFAPQLGTPTVTLDGPFQVVAGGSIVLSATGADPEGQELTYAWDLDGDGSFEVSGQSAAFSTSSEDSAGLRTVRVMVTDTDGNTATAETRVEVSLPHVNHLPVARCRDITVPADTSCGAEDSVNNGSYDPDEGDAVACVQTPSGPYVMGAQRVTLSCTDAAGLSSSCEATVTVREWGPLSLVLRGDAEMTLECGVESWVDPGARAWDSCGPLEVQSYNSGHDPYGSGPNVNAEGTYSVQYIVWNSAGQTVSATRTVHVDDRLAPILDLKGPQYMTHQCGSVWVDPGVEAIDACYGDVSPMVVRTGDYVNGWVPGRYTVHYEVRDSGGNSASPMVRTVDVVNCPW